METTERPDSRTTHQPITERGLEHVNLWMAVTSAILSAFCVLLLLGVGLPRQDKYIRDFGEASQEIKGICDDIKEFRRIQRTLQKLELILDVSEKQKDKEKDKK